MTNLDSKLVYFTLEGEQFGIQVTFVSEILKVDSIETYPSTSDTIIGITQIRDEVVTLIDTKSILFDPKESEWNKENCMDKYIILLSSVTTTEKNLGLIVDGVSKVVDIDLDSIDNSLFEDDSSVDGVLKDESELVPIIAVSDIDISRTVNNEAKLLNSYIRKICVYDFTTETAWLFCGRIGGWCEFKINCFWSS